MLLARGGDGVVGEHCKKGVFLQYISLGIVGEGMRGQMGKVFGSGW